MPRELVCATPAMTEALRDTVVFRDEFERPQANTLEQARALAPSAALVLVERDIPWASDLVRALRSDPATRSLSVAVAAPYELGTAELELLQEGASAVLRLPVTDDWNRRLAGLLQVTARQKARLPIRLRMEGRLAPAQAPFTAEVLDLSETGMLVESGLALEVGCELEFSVPLPGSPAPLAGRARVVRPAGHHRYGLELLDLRGEAEARLRLFLAEEAAGS